MLSSSGIRKIIFLFIILFSFSVFLWAQFDFFVETDSPVYEVGEPIHITLTLQNNSNEVMSFISPCTPYYYYTIDGFVYPTGVYWAVTHYSVAPGEGLILQSTYEEDLELGDHTITGGLYTAQMDLETEPISITVNAVETSEDQIQAAYSLQNYPNPFNPSTTISFVLPEGGDVSLDIFDCAGKRIKCLVSSYLPAGEHALNWDGKCENGGQVASGIYFYKLKTGKCTSTKKMILMK